jgi:hypothetical protein
MFIGCVFFVFAVYPVKTDCALCVVDEFLLSVLFCLDTKKNQKKSRPKDASTRIQRTTSPFGLASAPFCSYNSMA